MDYDPFVRGPFPVAVRTLDLTDEARGGRSLPLEIWYPATDAYAGRDLDETRDRYEVVPGFGLPSEPQDAVRDAAPRPGPFPLVLFSHGYGGHRRQSTFLCTHLASHGYVVAAPDHSGNTVVDVMMAVLARQTEGPTGDPAATLPALAAARPADLTFVLDPAAGRRSRRRRASAASAPRWRSRRRAARAPSRRST
jgi:predicted dienelactone hydrolase